jgi:hypothetical protein
VRSLFAWAALLAAVGFVPLFGGPRYEAALFAGLVGPFWCAAASALRTLRLIAGQEVRAEQEVRDGGAQVCSGTTLLQKSATVGLSHVLLLLFVELLHGVRVGFCEPGVGFGLLLLGPGLGMLLGAAWGAFATLFWSSWGLRASGFRTFLSVLTSLFGPLGCIGYGLFHFYDSPSVFAYSPFVGYFAGPLYDTVEYDLERLAGYRTGTLLTLAAVYSALPSVQLLRGRGSRVRLGFLPRTPERVVLLLAATVFSLGSLAHSTLEEEMGYSSSTESIRRALGRSLSRARCTVFFSRGVNQEDAALVAEECVGHLAQIEGYFGVSGYPGVDVYLFASANEKRRQMGAGTTYIAKPWRREIYIQPDRFPHQVLGHELAHAVTGSFGSGPLRVAGLLGGLLPDPGRIEGFAEAASPREGSEGTLHEWVAAMRQLRLLPQLGSLFQLSFLGASPANAYAAAGSFVDFLHGRHGPDALRKWYAGEDLTKLTGSSLAELEAEWHKFLDAVVVSANVIEIARARFSRPAVFERRCPHAVDRLLSESVDLCPYQESKAIRLAEEAVRLDPTKKDIELRNQRCAFYAGDAERSRLGLLDGAAREKVYEPNARRAALEFAGDIAWGMGKLKEAREAYTGAAALTFGIDPARNLEVKLWALDQEKSIQDPLRALLAPAPRDKKNPQGFLTEWHIRGPQKSFAQYLLSRVLEGSGAWAEGDELAFSLDAKELPLPSLRLEARKMKLVAACRRGFRLRDAEELERALKEYLAEELPPAAVLEATRLAERCRAAVAARKGVL